MAGPFSPSPDSATRNALRIFFFSYGAKSSLPYCTLRPRPISRRLIIPQCSGIEQGHLPQISTCVDLSHLSTSVADFVFQKMSFSRSFHSSTNQSIRSLCISKTLSNPNTWQKTQSRAYCKTVERRCKRASLHTRAGWPSAAPSFCRVSAKVSTQAES